VEPELLKVKDVAALTRLGSGRLPRCVRCSRSVRWRRATAL